jgi:HAD superfamily hydrolase (TIGR01509 family)
MKNLQHFIWDFDGTLFDTYPVIIEDLNRALQEFGHGCEMKEAMRLMQDRLAQAQQFYAEKYGIPMAEVAAAYERHHARSNRELLAEPMAGIREVLEAIRSSGRHSYIFSHRKPDETADYLKKYGLSHYFTHIIGPGSEGFAWKPAPDGILRLMERHGMTREDTLMIGDRDCDLGSARNAGIRTAHLICPAVPQELQCDWKLDGLRQMLEMM